MSEASQPQAPRAPRRGPAPRPPPPPPGAGGSPAAGGAADVFVNMRTDFRAQLRRCQRLLAPGGRRELRLHGLGLAVPRAINLALQLQAAAPGALRLHASTSTVALPGPPGPPGGPRPGARHNSAIHIRLCRPPPRP